MKVCLMNDSFPPVIDGVVNVVMNYARIMTDDALAECMVATPRYPDTDYGTYPYEVVDYHSIDTTKLISGYRAGNPLDFSAFRRLKEFSPDIIHTHCPVASTVLARMLRRECDAPVIFTYHTKFDVDIARAIKSKFLQHGSIKTIVDNISACDEVWVVSNGSGENLRSLGYEGEYRVMPNGVDFERGRADSALIDEVRAGYDLPEGVPVFLYVGRIIEYKGLPMIMEALRTLSKHGIDYRMVFVGDGPDREKLMKQAGQDPLLVRKVIFPGAERDRQRLRAWNSLADLFLFPSTYDTNGIVVREAAACGLASVLIRDSCAAEGVTDDRNGFLIEEDAQALSELLTRACADMDHVHEVGRHAMDEIYISWDSAVRLAHERYSEILDLKRTGQFVTQRRKFTQNLKKLLEEDVATLERNVRDILEELE